MKNKIYALIGPSGSGKTTIGDFIKLKGVNEIVSHTTREQRKGETDDTYYFVDREYMETHKDDFIELVEYSGSIYGTSKKEVEEKLKLGHCYSILNRKGVELFQDYFGKENVVVIYFDIEMDEMETRMRERGDSEVDIQKRINNALETGEFDNFDIADYIVKQKELRKVKIEVEGIVRSHRKPVLSVDIDDVVAEFLDALLKEYNKRYDDNVKSEDITGWNLASYLKCGNDVWQIVLEKHFMEGLPVTKDAVEVLERLNNHFDIQFVTASRISSHERRNWVEKYFPFIGQKKTIFACDKTNIDTDILVDDGLHNLVACSGEPICFARPHNHDYKGLRLNGWLEIEEYLIEEIVNV